MCISFVLSSFVVLGERGLFVIVSFCFRFKGLINRVWVICLKEGRLFELTVFLRSYLMEKRSLFR